MVSIVTLEAASGDEKVNLSSQFKNRFIKIRKPLKLSTNFILK